MRRIRGLKKDQEDDFSISTPDQIIEQFDKIRADWPGGHRDFGAWASVGGIGVMNICW